MTAAQARGIEPVHQRQINIWNQKENRGGKLQARVGIVKVMSHSTRRA